MKNKVLHVQSTLVIRYARDEVHMRALKKEIGLMLRQVSGELSIKQQFKVFEVCSSSFFLLLTLYCNIMSAAIRVNLKSNQSNHYI